MTRILFISSEHTGCGHRSITEALSEQLTLLAPDIQFMVIDGFALGNGLLRFSSRGYDSFAVKFPFLWGLVYQLSNPFKGLVNAFIARSIRKSLLTKIRAFQPDLVVSVHNLFVGSVIRVLNRSHQDIPVVSLVADLDNITGLWADKRAACVVCPSEEARMRMLKSGMAAEQLAMTGFPVRDAFCTVHFPEPHRLANREPISILLMSGSQGSAQVLKIAQTLLHDQRVHLTLIAGRNADLKKKMETALSAYIGNRAVIYGFTSEVKKLMMEADLLIMRASPNVLMEAVNLCKPVIVTGALRGQEAKNPQFVVRHKLGLYCRSLKDLPKMVAELVANDGERLKEIAQNQYRFRTPDSARVIAELLIRTAKEANTTEDRPIA
ncbi:galactosyldiacylglycerol synthase [Sporolactobacillus shoreicorticis]|uniref:Glycosyltransferase n=1 Tax=Sporolactobacillus shoreicorticis TaxID=1923877 RepID=A0ABW5S4X3_9BACL|nr:glycosyltransferase [Sporolactobacillus shoreicorticis]MCO7124361.1 galactosyldiacylglycerol synthase [Sporolactobacillus shoreicorticis]